MTPVAGYRVHLALHLLEGAFDLRWILLLSFCYCNQIPGERQHIGGRIYFGPWFESMVSVMDGKVQWSWGRAAMWTRVQRPWGWQHSDDFLLRTLFI